MNEPKETEAADWRSVHESDPTAEGPIVLHPIAARPRLTERSPRLRASVGRRIVEDPPGFAKFARGDGGRRESESAREVSFRELVEKNAELERFASTIAHDLKAPLTGILGFATLMEKALDAGRPDRIRSYAAATADAGRQMLQMIDALLDLGRAGQPIGPMEKVSLDEVAGEAVAAVGGILSQRGAIVTLGSRLPMVCGDRGRLRQVLVNLIVNGVKFARPGIAPHVELTARTVGETVTCAVLDHGVGATSQTLSWMFESFVRGTSEVEGSGLGLAIAKRIVEAHGGRIWAESEGLGEGCTVFFTLPATK